MRIILEEQHVKEVENFANELPTKYGAPLLNFLNKLANEQGQIPTNSDASTMGVQSAEEVHEISN